MVHTAISVTLWDNTNAADYQALLILRLDDEDESDPDRIDARLVDVEHGKDWSLDMHRPDLENALHYLNMERRDRERAREAQETIKG